tara:strand:- start:1813 stop:2241 length:429 start_codon:yes stop_codon:yes gene_type:complete
MKKIILCDIDGTIANNDHRQHFLEGKKDWEGFFKELIYDKPIHSVINKINTDHKAGKEIIFLTGRPERYRHATHKWLCEYFKFNIKILMRQDGDKRNKIIIKKEIFESNFNKNDIYYVIDNDPDLIHMWNEFSLVTYNAIDI